MTLTAGCFASEKITVAGKFFMTLTAACFESGKITVAGKVLCNRQLHALQVK